MKSEIIHPAHALHGILVPPGDKSVSHRAIMFSSLADGESHLSNMLMAEDCLSTVSVFRSLGVHIDIVQPGEMIIKGRGLASLQAPSSVLDCGNSGTTMRLVSGILAAQPFTSVLTGDASLQARPMDRVVIPLRKMGARITGVGERICAPLTIEGCTLTGIDYEEPRGSAQVKSCILLAGFYAQGVTTVIEKKVSRDHTERMMELYGVPCTQKERAISIRKITSLKPQSLRIPGDISSAAFFIVAALIVPDSEVTIEHVGLNATRCGCLTVLKNMGATIHTTITNEHGEPYGNIVAQSSKLKGVTIDGSVIPLLIDELPILMVAASFASGETRIEGAEELRVKETDRIKSMVSGLKALGVAIEETETGVIITGNGGIRCKGNAQVNSFKDHRTAMSLAVAALYAERSITIDDSECVAISYPHFFDELERLRQ